MIRYLKQQGTTVIIIDHRLDYALDLADNIYYIDSGQLQQCFTVNDFRALEQQQYETMGLRYQACPIKTICLITIINRQYTLKISAMVTTNGDKLNN